MLGQWEVPERLRVRIRALDYDAATAHGNTWEVPKGLHVRMRARRICTQLLNTTRAGGPRKAACAHVRARELHEPEQPEIPQPNAEPHSMTVFFAAATERPKLPTRIVWRRFGLAQCSWSEITKCDVNRREAP